MRFKQATRSFPGGWPRRAGVGWPPVAYAVWPMGRPVRAALQQVPVAHHASSRTGCGIAHREELVRILVQEKSERHGIFRVEYEGEHLCDSTQPLLDAARILINDGNKNEVIEMAYINNPDVVTLFAPIGVAAKYTVEENNKYGPRFKPWRPFNKWSE
jgi:hypothetical protein